jgi:hypothetical protein
LSNSADVNQWAQDVLANIQGLDVDQLSQQLQPVIDLASQYLTHLLIAGLSHFMCPLTVSLIYCQFAILVAQKHHKILLLQLHVQL